MFADEKKISKTVYWCLGCTGCCGITMIILGIVLPIILNHLIYAEAAKQTVMTSDTYDLWVHYNLQFEGQVPGKTGAVIERRFTFFDFVNPLDVMFRNQKPKFVEVGPFVYQELQNFTNPRFSDDDSIVEFDFWVHFKKLDNSDDDTPINFANFIALGAWYQMNNVEHALMSLQTLGQLITGFEQAILPNVIMNAYVGTFIPKYNYESVRVKLLTDLPEAQAKRIWEDQYFGMANVSSLVAWYNAAVEGYLSDTVFCANAPNAKCTPQYLTAKQWAQQGLTKDPPIKGFPSSPSVIIGNNTAWGYPELGYFQTVYFKENIDDDPAYQEYIPIDTAMKIINHTVNYNYEEKNFLSDPWILLNIGNMRQLLFNGEMYTKDPVKNAAYLTNIAMKQTYGVNEKQARVLYEYVKYVGGEFAQQTSRNGNTSTASMGGIISQTIYDTFSDLQNFLLPKVIAQMMYKRFPECQLVLAKIDEITQAQIDAFCSLDQIKKWNEEAISEIINLCDEPETDEWKLIFETTGLKQMQLLQLCDYQQDGFGQALGNTHAKLKSQYECENERCSKREIAIKQWMFSQVSKNPPEDEMWTPSDTVKTIYPQIFPNEIEYNWFYNSFQDVLPPRKQLSKKDIEYLLSYDCLFSATMIINALLYEINGQIDNYKTWFIFDEFKQLNHYFRYMMVSIPFGGLSQRKTVKEILFGFEDPLLQTLSTMDPALGGDPSIPYIIGLNLNNTQQQTQKQSMYTGKADHKMVRKYYKVNDKSYLTIPQPFFDGKQVTTVYKNPWNIESMLDQGTDSFCFHSNIQKNEELGIVVTDLVRSAKIFYTETRDYYGLETYYMNLDEEFYRINPIYNNDKYVGLVNFTTVQNAPVFNSFTHFYKADPYLANAVEIYNDREMKNLQVASEWDASYVQVEPITGVGVSALLNLQINVEYKPDFLFPSQNNYALLPFLWVYRGANFTESQVNDFLGPLKTGLKAKWWIRLVGIIIGVILLITCGWIYFFKIKRRGRHQQVLLQEQAHQVENQDL